MTLLPQKPLARLATRLRRSRPGSVLIIVIVLLLLLAILGATYISTTRSARVASAQNVLSDDVDDTLNGLAKICDGIIVDDLNDTFGDLHGNTAYTSNTTIANRSFYQGQAGTTPRVTPDAAAANPGPGYSYNPGDVVNDAIDPLNFYTVQGTAAVTLNVNIPNPPPSGLQIMNGHLPFTADGSDPWLADRIPDPAGAAQAAMWQYLTQAIGTNSAGALSPVSILGTPFEDPLTGAAPGLSAPLVGGTTISPTPLIPTYETINGLNIPALYYNGGKPFTAGDADGDGIADCLLFRVPGMSLDGLTWYAGVRIIDNNSAINANTAWSRDQDFIYTAGNPTDIPNYWNLFQTSVGLQEIANTSDTQNTLTNPSNLNSNQFRINNTVTVGGKSVFLATQTPYDESAINANVPPAALNRADYNFLSEGEALYQQFIRRLANPGYNPYTSATVNARYQALPLSDEAALAYHFCLVNPETTISQVPSSLVENLLPYSLWKSSVSPYAPYYRSIPYGGNGAADVAQWYKDNFNYGIPGATTDNLTTVPARGLFVTHNPVSNYVQQVYNNNNGATNVTSYAVSTPAATQPSISDPILPNYMLPYSGPTNTHFKGPWVTTGTYGINDIVVFPNVVENPGYNGPSYTFIYVNATSASGQLPATFSATNVMTGINTAYWQLQPWSLNPTKANVNTATFRELFRAFWSVMAGNPSNATPFGYTKDTTSSNGIYDDSAGNPQMMFRSPLRDPTSATPGTASELDGPATTQPTTGTNTNTNTMLLRAALAAVNTMGLRDNSQNIISKTIILKNAWVAPSIGATPVSTDVEVRVYSSAPQPFISEVYVNTNAGKDATTGLTNLSGYVAVELFNPYPVPLTLINWTVAYVNRQAKAGGGTYPNLQLTTIGTIGTTAAPVVIQPSGYALIENCNYTGAPTTQPDADAATYRPTDSGILPTAGTGGEWTGPATPTTQPSATGTMYQDIYMPFLENVIKGTVIVPPGETTPSLGGELVILRPRRADGTLTTYTDPANSNAAGSESFDEVNNTADLVPVDSYDFTNLQQDVPGPADYYSVWNYVRAKGNDVNNFLFRTTYPGTYNAIPAITAGPRETATYAVLVASGVSLPAPTSSGPTSGPGSTTQPTTQPSPSFGESSSGSVVVDNTVPPPVQVYNIGSLGSGYSSHFPNPVVVPDVANGAIVANTPPYYVTGVPPYYHPLGGFARNGDMLDIPFIGAYRIRPVDITDTKLVYPSTSFLELNSLPMDCSFAVVNDATAAYQNIGRFVPLAASYDYVKQGLYTNLPDYYAWTRNLFNYLTVQSSTDAYLPNFDSNLSSSNYTGTAAFAYPPQNKTPVPPTPTLTADATATDQTKQDNVGIEGLININTASWKVLSMLPFVPSTTANASKIDQQIAQNIVNYRLTYGPFTSIFDLNQVPGFQSGTAVSWTPPALPSPTAPSPPSSATGLTSPADPNFGTASALTTPTDIAEDYQWDCLTLDRISNLVTTRSDTFTIYIELQGWQNVGSTNAAMPPQPMVTRRFAYIVDRNGVNADPSTRYLKTLVVPNN